MRFDIVLPILGFEDMKEAELERIDDIFAKLKGNDGKKEVSFTLIDPFVLRKYEIEIPEYYKKLLDIEEKDNILTLCSMIVEKPIENSKVNFIAPFVFNIDKKKMLQVVLDERKYKDYGIMENISDYIRG